MYRFLNCLSVGKTKCFIDGNADKPKGRVTDRQLDKSDAEQEGQGCQRLIRLKNAVIDKETGRQNIFGENLFSFFFYHF